MKNNYLTKSNTLCDKTKQKKIGIKGNFLNFISSIYKTNKGKTANITHNGAKLESFP